MPDLHLDLHLDRARGALLGLAVGDALGTTLEFQTRDTYPPLTDMVGGGPFDLEPGEWTDDTSMAIALADSLIERDALDEHDLMSRFWAWWRNGAYTPRGYCVDIGRTTSESLSRYRSTGNPVAGSTDADTAGNGSLMRLAPVAIRFVHDADKRADAARRQSHTTHGAEEAVAACQAYADLLAEAIRTGDRDTVLTPRTGNWPAQVARAMRMETLGWDRDDVRSTGYVIHTLEAALWAVGNAGDYREAVLSAANLGRDADTTAAVAGQLAGALWGASAIPEAWLSRLAWRDRITDMADRLYARCQ